MQGKLRLRLLLRPGFKSTNIGLTDHFSPPFDELDNCNNLYNVSIDQVGRVAKKIKLELGRWYGIDLEWDNSKRECQVVVDGQHVAVVPQHRSGGMLSYLRLRSMAHDGDDAGILIERVAATVDWPSSR